MDVTSHTRISAVFDWFSSVFRVFYSSKFLLLILFWSRIINAVAIIDFLAIIDHN